MLNNNRGEENNGPFVSTISIATVASLLVHLLGAPESQTLTLKL